MNLYQRLLEIERRQTQIERYRAELGASIQTAAQDQLNMDSGEIASLANGDNGIVAPYDLVTSCEIRFLQTRVFTNYTGNPTTGSTFLWNGQGEGWINPYDSQTQNPLNMTYITTYASSYISYLFEWTTLSFAGSQTASGFNYYQFQSLTTGASAGIELIRNNNNSIHYLRAGKRKDSQSTQWQNAQGIEAYTTGQYGNDTPLKSGTTGTYQFGSSPYDSTTFDLYFGYYQPGITSTDNWIGPSISQVGYQPMSLFEVRW